MNPYRIVKGPLAIARDTVVEHAKKWREDPMNVEGQIQLAIRVDELKREEEKGEDPSAPKRPATEDINRSLWLLRCCEANSERGQPGVVEQLDEAIRRARAWEALWNHVCTCTDLRPSTLLALLDGEHAEST